MRKKLNMTAGIFPMPVLLIATYNEDGTVRSADIIKKNNETDI